MIDTLNAIYPGLGWLVLGAIPGAIVGAIIGIPLRRFLERRHEQEPAP